MGERWITYETSKDTIRLFETGPSMPQVPNHTESDHDVRAAGQRVDSGLEILDSGDIRQRLKAEAARDVIRSWRTKLDMEIRTPR